ncbi:MAG: DUF4823 domain-containing protein [Bacteroidales bacterium]|jgi:hypothetical protein|nr:DUF4823 domain-containing protein [Bacteroidales bacterium]
MGKRNKKIIAFLITILGCFTLNSCFTTMQHLNLMQNENKIERNKIIYIANVVDGTFDGKVYSGSGQNVAYCFLKYMRPFAASVIIGENVPNYKEDAKAQNADYIVKPVIVHWEPRAAAWSGIPTKVSIIVSITDVISNKELINKELQIKGRSFTFVSQSAESLADEVIEPFCYEIF